MSDEDIELIGYRYAGRAEAAELVRKLIGERPDVTASEVLTALDADAGMWLAKLHDGMRAPESP
jgi:hypothetical protein